MLLARHHLEPDDAVACSGRKRTTGRSGSGALSSVAPTQRAPVSSTISSVAQTRAALGEVRVDAFSQRFEPSVRSRRRSDVRRIDAARSSPPRAAPRSSSEISVSSPPMIPAEAIERSASAIIRSTGRGGARRRRASASSRPGARAGRRSPRPRGVVEGVQRVAEPEHDVVRHVDDVRDRPHAGGGQASLIQRRRADAHVAEHAGRCSAGSLVVLDGHVYRLVARERRVSARRRRELSRTARHLARDAVHGEEVGPVPGDLEVEDDVLGAAARRRAACPARRRRAR